MLTSDTIKEKIVIWVLRKVVPLAPAKSASIKRIRLATRVSDFEKEREN